MEKSFYWPKKNEWARITIEGPDALDYLHRLSTADLKSLSPGKGTPAFFLNAKGKIQASFTLWCTEKNSYVLEFNPGENQEWKERLLTLLETYHFGEDLNFASDDTVESLWVFGETNSNSQNSFFHGDMNFGIPWTTFWGIKDELRPRTKNAKELTPDELDFARIKKLSPRTDFEITQDTNPLEIGGQGGISQSKGCYPGQEVIERIQSRGAAPRKLVLLEGSGSPTIQQSLLQDEKEAGKITSFAYSKDGKAIVLALLGKNYAKTDFEFKDPNGKIYKVVQILGG